MQSKTLFTIVFIIISLGLIAQGKFYITPRIGYHSGSYRGVDSVNNRQNLFTTRNFQWKSSIIGITLNYYTNRFETSVGIEEGVYASGFYYSGDKLRPDNVVSYSSAAQRYMIIFNEFKYDAFSWNIRMPKWLRNNETSVNNYLLVSSIMPMLGFEYRYMPTRGRFINHSEVFHAVETLVGVIPYAVSYNAYKKTQFSLRTGVDWVFYDGEKRRFIITLMYSLAFKDAGYHYYRFYYDTPQEFHYRNNTKGNGISLKVGVPFKILEIKSK